jgi:hypothetical protein
MRPVIIESPYAGDTAEERNTHRRYALACLRDSLDRGEAPIASHLLHTQVLDDTDPDERKTGMRAGWAWYGPGVVCVVYQDLGISDGMAGGVGRAGLAGSDVELRALGDDWQERFAFLWTGESGHDGPQVGPSVDHDDGTQQYRTMGDLIREAVRQNGGVDPLARIVDHGEARCTRCAGPHASEKCSYYRGER